MKNTLIRKSRLAVAVAGALVAGHLSAAEFSFNDGKIYGRLDTALSVGMLFRTEQQDRMLAANGDPVAMAAEGFSTQLNKNDANNNFDADGRVDSMVYKITPELLINFGDNWGIFTRATALYDSVIMGESILNGGGHQGGALNIGACAGGCATPFGINRYAEFSDHANNGTGRGFSDAAKSDAGKRFRMLDAYVFHDSYLFDRPLNVRVGQQVISWGESLFIQNGINSLSYLDLNALRLPGSEIKEALLPLDAVYFNYGLTDTVSWEAFYQFEWNHSRDAAAGTFWSTHDSFPGKGADNVIVDGRLVAAAFGVPAIADAFAQYTLNNFGQSGVDYEFEQTQVTVNRLLDKSADDQGQFGTAFRYFSSLFGGTEFGFFYHNTHAKLPVVGARLDMVGAGSIPEKIDSARYFMVYEEDIDMFGASFSTGIGKLSLSGEVAYRPEQPIINEVGDNLLQNLSRVAASAAPTIGDFTPHCVRASIGGSCLRAGDEVIQGQEYFFYDEAETVTATLVGIYNFGPFLGTDNLIMVLEGGIDVTNGLDDNLNFASTASLQTDEALIQSPGDPNRFFLTDEAWGYRAVLAARFNDIYGGVGLNPSFRFAHDVNGNSPLGGNFLEDRKSATLGFEFVYLNRYVVDLNGTMFWGNEFANKLSDRDNVSIAFSYSF